MEQTKALPQDEGGQFLDGLTSLSDEAAAALRANRAVGLPDQFQRQPPGVG